MSGAGIGMREFGDKEWEGGGWESDGEGDRYVFSISCFFDEYEIATRNRTTEFYLIRSGAGQLSETRRNLS